jgi:hypothetical protein
MKPGDIILTYKGALFSKLIKLFNRQETGDIYMAHCGIVIDDNTYIETDFRARLAPINALDSCANWEIWECPKITDLERIEVVAKAKSYFDRTYSITKLALHAFDAILGKIFMRDIFLFRKLSSSDKYIICSWIPACAYKVIGFEFTDPYYAATPDNIHTFVKKYRWNLVDSKT